MRLPASGKGKVQINFDDDRVEFVRHLWNREDIAIKITVFLLSPRYYIFRKYILYIIRVHSSEKCCTFYRRGKKKIYPSATIFSKRVKRIILCSYLWHFSAEFSRGENFLEAKGTRADTGVLASFVVFQRPFFQIHICDSDCFFLARLIVIEERPRTGVLNGMSNERI